VWRHRRAPWRWWPNPSIAPEGRHRRQREAPVRYFGRVAFGGGGRDRESAGSRTRAGNAKWLGVTGCRLLPRALPRRQTGSRALFRPELHLYDFLSGIWLTGLDSNQRPSD
jgi:hypothetical protein